MMQANLSWVLRSKAQVKLLSQCPKNGYKKAHQTMDLLSRIRRVYAVTRNSVRRETNGSLPLIGLFWLFAKE